MGLLLTRIVLTAVLCYAGFLIWTNNVDLVSWAKRAVRQKLPIATTEPEGLLRISYQGSEDGTIAVVFQNDGTNRIGYFTAQIRTKTGVFRVKDSNADFDLSVPPSAGGSWIVISGRDMLPGNHGCVTLQPQSKSLALERPEVTSDSPYKFIGQWTLKWGAEERSDD